MTLHGFSMIFGVWWSRRALNFMNKNMYCQSVVPKRTQNRLLSKFHGKLEPHEGLKTRHGGLWAPPFYYFFCFGRQSTARSPPKAHHEPKNYQKVPKSSEMSLKSRRNQLKFAKQI